MSDSTRLSQETLQELRALLQQCQSAPHQLPLTDAITVASQLTSAQKLTIDMEARHTLGQPMVVLQLDSHVPLSFAPLTPREREVASHVAQGLRNKEIAMALHISLATVKDHVHHILTKLELPNRTMLAAKAPKSSTKTS